MNRIILNLLACLLVANVATAQLADKKPSSIGVHFILNDFPSANALRTQGLTTAIRNHAFTRLDSMNAGMGISYWKGLTRHIDFAGELNGSFAKYPVPNKAKPFSDKFFLEATATANIKLLTDKYTVVPYLTAGIGANAFQGYFSAILPVGVGFQINFGSGTFLMLNSQYRIRATENAAYNIFHSAGIVKTVSRPAPKPAPVVEVPVVLDRDGDGVLDADDKCPDVPGLASLMGCPDRDGDGIADGDDNCPDVAGLAKYQGCPIPDTDGDGINDEMDKCPTVKGFARYQGCPIPDTDGDGVNDEMDKCPTRPGTAANQGCPEIAREVIEKVSFAAKNVFFSTGSYKLLPKSYKSLDGVVDLMKSDESLMIDIDGHTDAQGSDESNQVLSENRAKAVKDYFVSKGISESRLKATGYGETTPVADNTTAAGRAKNRRTEMTVRNF